MPTVVRPVPEEVGCGRRKDHRRHGRSFLGHRGPDAAHGNGHDGRIGSHPHEALNRDGLEARIAQWGAKNRVVPTVG